MYLLASVTCPSLSPLWEAFLVPSLWLLPESTLFSFWRFSQTHIFRKTHLCPIGSPHFSRVLICFIISPIEQTLGNFIDFCLLSSYCGFVRRPAKQLIRSVLGEQGSSDVPCWQCPPELRSAAVMANLEWPACFSLQNCLFIYFLP